VVKRLVVGLSGASGAIYGVRLLEVLKDTPGVETHLIVSRSAEVSLGLETGRSLDEVNALADVVYDHSDLAAPLSSGSFLTLGMMVVPCSMKSLAQIALSLGDNLLARAADVTLKERRRLVLVTRETPLHLGHLRNMTAVTEMGGVVLPPVHSFYHDPKTIMDVVDQTVGKMLDLFEIGHDLFRRWGGVDA
jgi:4-hydroxy-3-polyprenylbenzoate decarboxylase